MIIITAPPSINCHPLITTGLSCAPNFLISPVLHALASIETMTKPSPMKLIPPSNPSFVQLTTTMPATPIKPPIHLSLFIFSDRKTKHATRMDVNA